MSMSTESKISVVINTYNARQHLRQVLESVKDFDEVVVCDMELPHRHLPQGRP